MTVKLVDTEPVIVDYYAKKRAMDNYRSLITRWAMENITQEDDVLRIERWEWLYEAIITHNIGISAVTWLYYLTNDSDLVDIVERVRTEKSLDTGKTAIETVRDTISDKYPLIFLDYTTILFYIDEEACWIDNDEFDRRFN